MQIKNSRQDTYIVSCIEFLWRFCFAGADRVRRDFFVIYSSVFVFSQSSSPNPHFLPFYLYLTPSLCYHTIPLSYYLIARLDMHHDTRYIGKYLLDLALHLMSDEMSLTDGLFSIDEEMQLDDTVESTLSDDTRIDIEDGFILSYDD